LADDEESHTALKILRARFLSRDCGIGMTVWAGLSRRLQGRGLLIGFAGGHKGRPYFISQGRGGRSAE
jgi:phosphopantetheinyl transferase